MNFLIGWHMLDIFFLLLGCYFVIRGVFRGLVGEALSLGGLILSIYTGFRYSETLGRTLGSAVGLNKEVACVLSLVLVWLTISIIFSVLRRILRSVMDIASLGSLDRILGIFCGLFKTITVLYAVMIGGLLLSPIVEPTWMSHSDALICAGRKWPEVRRLLLDFGVLPPRTDLPDSTLEQIMRPYRRENRVPGALNTAEAWAFTCDRYSRTLSEAGYDI